MRALLVGLVAALAACSAATEEESHGSESAWTSKEEDEPKGANCGGSTPLVAFKGGTSIALRWSTTSGNTSGAGEYIVYRDGKKLAKVKPGFHPDFPEKDGKGYIDTDIKAGTSYVYRVELVDAKGAVSPLGASLCVRAPSELTSPPTITADSSKVPELAEAGVQAKAFLEIWYPKLAFALMDYKPTSSFTVRIDPTAAATDGQLIAMDANQVRDHRQEALGAIFREATRLAIASRSTPAWVVDGVADWARRYMLHDQEAAPLGPNDHYLQGASPAAFFINAIETKYKKPIARPLTIASHNGTYSNSIFVEQTGKTIGKLWEEVTGRKERDAGLLRFQALANKCVSGSSKRAEVATCKDPDSMGWTWGTSEGNDGTIWIAAEPEHLCLATSGTSMGAGVDTALCDKSAAQKWQRRPDGTLLHPQSGFCLDDPDGKTVDGTQLRIWDCNASDAQKFTLPE